MLKDKISKEQFFEYLNGLKENSEMVSAIYNASKRNIDMINYEDEITKPYRIIEKLFFTKEELDYISWYVYEFDADRMKIYDANTHKVIANLETNEDLWIYLNKE